jgi:hypothetical protein
MALSTLAASLLTVVTLMLAPGLGAVAYLLWSRLIWRAGPGHPAALLGVVPSCAAGAAGWWTACRELARLGLNPTPTWLVLVAAALGYLALAAVDADRRRDGRATARTGRHLPGPVVTYDELASAPARLRR